MADIGEKELKQLKSYIKKYYKVGFNKDSLSKTLIDSGYDKKIVAQELANFEENYKKTFSERFKTWENKFKTRLFSKPHHFSKLYAILGVVFIIIVAFVLVLFLFQEKNCNYDKQCFIESALKGDSVSVKEEIIGSTLEYEFDGTTLIKRFVSFDSTEPQEVQDLLKGKKMTCTFDTFDETIIDGIFGGIEYCEGELKDVVYELSILSE